MYGEEQQVTEDQTAGELVTLEPVIVNQKHLARILAVFRQRAIFSQIERLPDGRVILWVLPDDYEHADHLATMASLPGAGCKLLALAMVWLVFVLPAIGLVWG